MLWVYLRLGRRSAGAPAHVGSRHGLALVTAAWTQTITRLQEQLGQGLVEYTLLVALIAFVVLAAVTSLGETIVSKLYTLGTAL